MPAPDSSQILDTPPPLTPAKLRNFPYQPRPFPASDLIQSLRFVRPAGAADAANPLPDNRVE